MKKNFLQLILSVCFISLTFVGYSQNTGVSISPTNTSADPSAILDINSTTQGTLITRMTQAQRNAIVNPALGLLIFNTTTNCINMWLGSNWKQVCGECDFSNPVPTNNGPVCFGQMLNLTATSISGATYQWAGPNGFTSTQQNPSIPNATAAASGSYSVTATVNGCASAPQTTVAIVNPTPATPIAGNNGPLCAGQTLNLTASNVASAGYSWTGPNSFTSTLQNPLVINVQVADAGNYSVVAVLNGCSSAEVVTTIAVSDVPATPGSISGPSTVTSSSSGIVYSISAVSGATSYTWTVPSGALIAAGGSTTSITVTFGGTGTGNVTVSATNYCGNSAKSSLPVTINPTVLSFTNTGTISWTAPSGITSVEVLVVAGGGQGGGCASGGGAGGLIYNPAYSVTPLQSYTVTVGAGGVNGSCSNGGNNGENSVFGTLVAIGGGGGGAGNSGGKSGGSGGGASWNGGVLLGGSGTPGQGSAGGSNNINQPPYPGAGGGGEGGVGGTPSSNTLAGNGGPGLQYSISGAPVYYAGGGGGGGYPACMPGSGGIGGGGNGGTSVNGSPGAPNTGGGGGGGDNDNGYSGGNGGSGIVIIKY